MTRQPASALLRRTAAALVALLCASILLISHPGAWPVHAFRTAVFSLTALWAFAYIQRPFEVKAAVMAWPLAAAAVWGGVQLLAGTTAYRPATADATFGWAANAAVLFLGLQIGAEPDVRRAVRQALLVFGAVLSVLSTIQLFSSEGKIFWIFETRYKDWVAGPFVNRDHFAAFVELLLPLALYEALAGARAVIYTVAAGAMFASVIASASRAGAVLATLEVALLLGWAVLRRGPEKRRAAVAMRVAAAAFAFTAVVGWQVLWTRLHAPSPGRDRQLMMASAVAMARERPWTGFGLGTFETVYPQYARFDDGLIVTHAHNDWAEWAAEGGLPLLAAMIAVAVWALRSAWRVPWAIGIAAVLLHAMVDFPMQKPALAACVFLLLGIAEPEARKRRAEAGALQPEVV